MGNLVLLILFLILRPVLGQLFSSQKKQTSQTPSRPQTQRKSERYPSFPIPDFVPTTVEEPKKLKVKPEVSNKPIKLVKLSRKDSKKSKTEPKLQTETETKMAIPDLITQDSILRGIILQEILSPPKALSQRRR